MILILAKMLPWEDYRTVQPFDLVKMNMMLISFRRFDKIVDTPQTVLIGPCPSPMFYVYRWCRIGIKLDDWTMMLAAENTPSVQVTKTCLQEPIAFGSFSHFFEMNISMRRRMQRAVCVIERHWERKKALDVIKQALRQWVRRKMHTFYLPGGRLMPQRNFANLTRPAVLN
jgi:hypothetical protein